MLHMSNGPIIMKERKSSKQILSVENKVKDVWVIDDTLMFPMRYKGFRKKFIGRKPNRIKRGAILHNFCKTMFG